MGQRVLSSIGLMQSKHMGRVVPGQFAMVYGSLLVHRFVCRFLVVFEYRFQRSKDTSVALGEQVTGVSGGGESTFINTSKVGSDHSRLDKVTLANRTRVSDVAGRCKVWGDAGWFGWDSGSHRLLACRCRLAGARRQIGIHLPCGASLTDAIGSAAQMWRR